MKIGVLSDSHGRVGTVMDALALLRDRGIDTVLHCGDIDDPPTVRLFRGFQAHFVFGNCDTDRDELRLTMAEVGATLHEPFGHVQLDGVEIAFVHGDNSGLLRDLERSDAFDFLFYGHTHVAAEHRTGRTRIINPGALHRARVKTFVVFDLATHDMESVPCSLL
jgi:putative phosphoesterase